MNDNVKDVIELTNESVESMIYEIRGQRVMLDFDLARIYGYETKNLNQQIKRNINKFPKEFMFKLNLSEARSILISQFVTSSWGGKRKLPYAFTEQGIYMLMTVLKGELATKQSIALIKAFKRMKDYLTETNKLADYDELVRLVSKVDNHEADLKVIKQTLNQIMDNFINPSTYKHFLILDGDKIEADVAYQTIYSMAKESIYIIDDYIGVKTLQLLKTSRENVKIIIFSDNKARNGLTKQYLEDCGLDTTLFKSKSRIHDRYIVLDYQTNNEKIYLCGSSSKDSGNKITTIMGIDETIVYHQLIDELFNESEILILK